MRNKTENIFYFQMEIRPVSLFVKKKYGAVYGSYYMILYYKDQTYKYWPDFWLAQMNLMNFLEVFSQATHEVDLSVIPHRYKYDG